MTGTIAIAVAAWVGLLSVAPVNAQAQQGQEIHLGQRYSLQSRILSEERPYLVYLPASYGAESARSNRYPVLYLLDGGAHFNAVSGVVHHLSSYNSGVQEIPEMIVVGIPNRIRVRDMTPVRLSEGMYSEHSGGAEAFRRFLSQELIPRIEADYRTNGERTLVGHSLAGLFALSTFLEQPALFDHYIAVDPANFWGKLWIVDRLQKTAIQLSKPTSVFQALANSPAEEYADPALKPDHEAGIRRFQELLEERAIPGLNLGYRFYEDETHSSSVLVAVRHGLKHVYAGYE